MKIRAFYRLLALALTATMLFGAGISLLVPKAQAATTAYKLAQLLEEGKIKPLGRTQASLLGDGITADWTGNGFEANLNVASGDILIGYNSNQSGTYSAVLVDGVQVWRGLTMGTGTVRVPVTPGNHTVSMIRENGHSSSATASFLLTTLAFDGTIEAKPANKSLYIEVIGDSYACGAGSAEGIEYATGVQWGDMDHSAQTSFGWYLSEMLNSDLSIVARGGIGLTGSGDAQEETYNDANMIGIYPNASGHNEGEGAYSFSRKPDLVVIEMGANDSVAVTDQAGLATWMGQLNTLIGLVRGNYGADTKILLLTHKSPIYTEQLRLADADENLWACYFTHHGNGAAALPSQKEGHPSAEDEYEIAEALYKSIQDWDILGAPAAAAAPTYTDITYYVSENGNDENDGKSIDKAKLTVKAAYDQAVSDNKNFAAGSRLVLQLQGSVLYATTNTQQFFETPRYTADGKKLPILVTTYDYSNTEVKAILDTGHKASSDGNGSICINNDVTFKDMVFQSTTRNEGKTDTNGNPVYFRDRNFYGGFNDIVFDNVTFAHTMDSSLPAGATTSNAAGWNVSPGRFGSFDPNSVTEDKKQGSVTFLNGDYTNLAYVAAVMINNYSNQTTAPGVGHKVIIGEGATMGNVYCLYGTLPLKSATVEFRGGTTKNYYPIRNGTAEARRTFNANITTIFSGGQIANTTYYGSGNYVTLNGSVSTSFKGGDYTFDAYYGTGENAIINGTVTNTLEKGRITAALYSGIGKTATINANGDIKGKLINNVSGGELRIIPTSATIGAHGLYFAGWSDSSSARCVINGSVENNISGGNILLLYGTQVDSGIYLGGRETNINGDLHNNISGGNLFVGQHTTAEIKSTGIYLGMYSGHITGTQYNTVTDGRLAISACKKNSAGNLASTGAINFGDRTVHNLTGKIVNVIGVKDSLQGPRILGTIALGGDKGYIGKNLGKIEPDASHVDSTIVVQSTIYSGYFSGDVYGATSSGIDYANNNYSYVIGSVQTDIYGGKIAGSFCGTGNAIVAGHVTTNIYGGSFCGFYGARAGAVLDGVETNIYGMTDLTTVYNRVLVSGKYEYQVPSYKLCAGGTTGTISAVTEGRDAVKLTIAPTVNSDVMLYRTIYAGCSSSSGKVEGTTSIAIKGGIYPTGLNLSGATVSSVIPGGYSAIDHLSGDALSYESSATALSDYVEIVPTGKTTSRELVYYVRPNGNDNDDGLSFVKANKTTQGAILKAIAHNDNSTVFPAGSKLTVYVDGTVNDNSGQFTLTDKKLTTADGKPMEITVATYQYSDTKATIVHNFAATNTGAARTAVTNDTIFKDISLLTKEQTNQTYQFLAGGFTVTFDNASLITNNDKKWIVSADHFTNGGNNPFNATEENPHCGVLIFKNGDYQDLDYVATVNSGSVWNGSKGIAEMPYMHCKVIIEDGAVMKDVYGPMGALKAGSSTVEVKGGTIATLNGTGSGTKNLSIDTNLIVSSGTVGTLRGTGIATKITLNGDVNITVSGGKITMLQGTGDDKYSSTANTYATVNGNVNIAVSGGNITTLKGTGDGCAVSAKDISITVSGGTISTLRGTGNARYSTTGDGTVTAENVSLSVSDGTVGAYFGTGVNQYTATTGDEKTPRYGQVVVTGKVKNTVSGGTITNFAGTNNGGSSAEKRRIAIGAVENHITGGTFIGRYFLAAGDYLTLSSISNTIEGGSFTINPTNNGQTSNYQKDAFFFAGRNCVTVTNVTNNISGGTFQIIFNETYKDADGATKYVDSGYYFGGGSSASVTNATNKISGGTFLVKDGKCKGSHVSFFLGQFSGKITDTLRNEITGGTFDLSGSTTGGSLYCGGRATKSVIGKIQNVIGVAKTGNGPTLIPKSGATLHLQLGSGWAQVGCTSALSSFPDASTTVTATKNVVIESSIYGGTFPSYVYGAPTGSISGNTYYNMCYGSVTTNIYGGNFSTYCGAGATPVYGHVTTNIYGGTFSSNILGSYDGIVYDGVELNIYGLDSDAKIYAGGTKATVSTTSAGYAGIKLNIAPAVGKQVVLSNQISAGFSGKGTNNGTTEVAVSGGTYPNGFAVVGVTVKEALAEGFCVVDDATGAPLAIGDKDTSSGTDSVTVLPMDESLRFSGASLKLYEDLAIIFKADDTCFGQDGYTDPYVKFYMGDKLLAVSEYSEDNGRLAFPFRNIAPHKLGDTVTATLYATKDGVLYAGKPAEYSVKQYCANMLTKASDHKALRTLLVDLLNYGAAAQTYAGHNTDKLVNADLTDLQKAWGTQGDPAVDNDVFTPTYATVENPTAAWQSGGLYLDDRICFRMTLEAADITDLSVKVELAGKSYSIAQEDLVPIGGNENLYYVYFDQLNAAQMRTPVLFTAYRGGVAVSHTIRYSIECYVADKQSNTETPNLADLVRSIIRYGDAAEAYIN